MPRHGSAGRFDLFAGPAHQVERRPRKSEAACSTHATSTNSIRPRSSEAGRIHHESAAPLLCNVSAGIVRWQDAYLVRRKRLFDSACWHQFHALVAEQADALRSDRSVARRGCSNHPERTRIPRHRPITGNGCGLHSNDKIYSGKAALSGEKENGPWTRSVKPGKSGSGLLTRSHVGQYHPGSPSKWTPSSIGRAVDS